VASITSLMSSCSRHKRRLAVPRIDPERLDALAQRSKFGQRLGPRGPIARAQLAERESRRSAGGSEVGLVLIRRAVPTTAAPEHIVRELARFPRAAAAARRRSQPADPRGSSVARLAGSIIAAKLLAMTAERAYVPIVAPPTTMTAGPLTRHHLSEPVLYNKDLVGAASWFGAAKYMLRPSRATFEVLGARYVEQRDRFLPRAASGSRTARHHHAPLSP